MTKIYEEGAKARENFEEGMKALFQVPKHAGKTKNKPAKKRAKKPTRERDASRDSGGEASSSLLSRYELSPRTLSAS